MQVTWKSPSNIALIKYWGKHGVQLPNNPSLSITLNRCHTETSVTAVQKPGMSGPSFEFFFEGKPNPSFSDRVGRVLAALKGEVPFLLRYHLEIQSRNTFPHSSGIASSASAMSALALCLCSIQGKIDQSGLQGPDFYRFASRVARLGSGSACRSVYGGIVCWGEHPSVEDSADEHAVPVSFKVHTDFLTMRDAVLIVSSGGKKVGSTSGHQLMVNHPFAESRYLQARRNFADLVDVLTSGDGFEFARVVENEALTLHAMMLSSDPGYSLFAPNTLLIIDKIRAFRFTEKIPLCFTLDAGPNVHVLYPDRIKPLVYEFIRDELVPLCENGQWIDDLEGHGPVCIKA